MNENYIAWIIPSKRSSQVKDDNCLRIKMAKQQKEQGIKSKETIINLTNKFLQMVGINEVEDPYVYPSKRELRRIDYAKIKRDSGIAEKNDIVWMKFTKNHFLGVVGTGCDINFNYDNTSGKIIKIINEFWDESEVLVFPLKNIPEGFTRSDIESGIGNYLIFNGVPILDYYSHNY